MKVYVVRALVEDTAKADLFEDCLEPGLVCASLLVAKAAIAAQVQEDIDISNEGMEQHQDMGSGISRQNPDWTEPADVEFSQREPGTWFYDCAETSTFYRVSQVDLLGWDENPRPDIE